MGKGECGESHAGYGRSDQKQQAKLDDSLAASSEGRSENPLQVSQFKRLARKDMVARRRKSVPYQKYQAAYDYNRSCQCHASAQQIGNNDFQILIGPVGL